MLRRQDIEEWAHLNRWVEEHESPAVVILPPGPVRERGIEIIDAMQKLGKPTIVVADANDAETAQQGSGMAAGPLCAAGGIRPARSTTCPVNCSRI